jgi:hypothetical protein
MLDKKKCGEIRDALEAHFESFDFEGIELSLGSARFSDQIVTFKLECAMPNEDGTATSKIGEDFKLYCHRYNLTPDDLGKEFSNGVDTFTIEGCKPRSTKYPILGKNVKTGKVYKFPVAQVKMFIER